MFTIFTPNKIFLINPDSAEEREDWMYAINNLIQNIGTPYNFAQHLHVEYDANNGFTGNVFVTCNYLYTGLPKEWESLLSCSGITKCELLGNI
jgi:hypothetical protein